MEKKLKELFDYQRFENNAQLEKLISDTGHRRAEALSDDDLSAVNAAGEVGMSSGDAGNLFDNENREPPAFTPGSRFWQDWLRTKE